MKAKRARAECPECPKYCFSGSTKDVEQNHIGGRQHVPWLTYPFGKKNHKEFHVMCRRAGVDFRYTKTKSIRLIQAMKAMLVGIWMVLDMLEKHLANQSEDES